MILHDRKRPKPAVTGILINAERKVLLTLRSSKVLWPGFWCLPGGHVQGGQDWLTAFKTEVLEEVGVEVTESKLVGIYSDPKVNTLVDPIKGEEHCFVVASFLVLAFKGQIHGNEEVEKWGWFDPADLPTPLLPSEPIKIADAFAFQGLAFVR